MVQNWIVDQFTARDFTVHICFFKLEYFPFSSIGIFYFFYVEYFPFSDRNIILFLCFNWNVFLLLIGLDYFSSSTKNIYISYWNIFLLLIVKISITLFILLIWVFSFLQLEFLLPFQNSIYTFQLSLFLLCYFFMIIQNFCSRSCNRCRSRFF